MKFTTTFTSKGQITVPKAVRDRLGYKSGLKVDIYPVENGRAFIGKLHRKSKILKFAGDLKSLDKGESIESIRLASQKLATKRYQ